LNLLGQGPHDTSKINLSSFEAMMETSIDISNQKPKELTVKMIMAASKIISRAAALARVSTRLCLAPRLRIVGWRVPGATGGQDEGD